jgi:hypothetical protein
VVLASEFGRDAMTEGKVGKEVRDQAINIPDVMTEPRHYGMHRHFTAAGSILMFGGGSGLRLRQDRGQRPARRSKIRGSRICATICPGDGGHAMSPSGRSTSRKRVG